MTEPPIYHEQDYLVFLDDIKTEIRTAQIKVARAANRQLIQLYWWLGKSIAENQEKLG